MLAAMYVLGMCALAVFARAFHSRVRLIFLLLLNDDLSPHLREEGGR